MYEKEEEFSLKQFFVPLTTLKAIHIIIFVGFIVFGNTIFNGFVWDDLIYILYNQQIHNFHLSTILGESLFNVGGQYRPIPAFYFSLLYSLFKDIPFFYHVFSICIHILNSILVFVLFNKFFKNYIAIFLSLIFLTHPMQVESATFIATSGNNLYFTFGLTALLLSLREEISLKRSLVITSLLILSYLSKETGILFFIIIFISRFFYHKKMLLNFFILEFCHVLYILFCGLGSDIYTLISSIWNLFHFTT